MKILIVEDDKNCSKLIATLLKEAGYDVTTAYSGLEGYTLNNQLQADLIITDLHMPYGDGISLLKTVKPEQKLPVIVISSSWTEEEKKLALDLGATDTISKPFDVKDFMTRVKRVLDQRAS